GTRAPPGGNPQIHHTPAATRAAGRSRARRTRRPARRLRGDDGRRRELLFRSPARCLCRGRRRSEFPSAGESCGSCRHRDPPRRRAPERALASSAQRRRRKLANAYERGGAVNAHLRRGICPALSHPMATGAGLLVRLTPTGTTMPCEAFAALCTAARRYGNGVIEITSRGSIQIRGLTEFSAKSFAAAVAGIDVAFCEGPPILSDPLAGLDPQEAVDAGAIAADLRRAIAAAPFGADIGPKVSVDIDGGGTLHLDALAADVRMRTQASSAHLHVAVGGDAETATLIGAVAAEHAVEAAMRMLRVIAAGGPAVRARDIVATNGAAAFSRLITDILVDLPRPPRRPAADPLGMHALCDGRVAIGLGLAFGNAHATALQMVHTAAGGVS